MLPDKLAPMKINRKNKTQEKTCTVYYDSACPLCSKEIATYKKWRGGEHVTWIDAISCPEQDFGDELERDVALAQLHLRDGNGRLLQGAAAFVELWKHFPSLAWATPWLSQQAAIKFLDVMYRVFLRIRPLWRKPLT